MKTIKLDLALFDSAPFANLSHAAQLLWLNMAAYCNTYRTLAVPRGYVYRVDVDQEIDNLVRLDLVHEASDVFVVRAVP